MHRHARSASLITIIVLSVFALAGGAQAPGPRLVAADFASASGRSESGSIRITGSLGGAFEAVEIGSGDVRVLSGVAGITRVPVTGDFDGDGTTGFTDFLIFAAAFGTQSGESGYRADVDLDGNGAIEFDDFLLFASAFGSPG